LHFSDFSTIFKRIYKFTGKSRKYKNTDCKGVPGILTEPPGNLKLFAQGSLAGVGDRGGGGGGFPGEEGLAGGWDGAQGRELTELYLRMGDAVDGGGRSRVGGGAQGAAAAAAADDGAPVWEEGQEPAGELHGAMRKLAPGSIGVGEGRGRGSAARGVLDGGNGVGGGVPRHWEALGENGRAWELPGGESKLAGCSIGVEEG
jgi:hypothetical protein